MSMRGIRLKYLLAPIFVLWLVGVGVAVIAATTPTAALMPTTAAHKDRPLPPTPALIVRKTTNGVYAPTPPGISIPVGLGVTWTYVITNTGHVTVTNLVIMDDKIGQIVTIQHGPCDPPVDALAPGATMICIIDTETAVAGQYSNTVTVTGTSVATPSVTVVVTDISHYLGSSTPITTYVFLPSVSRQVEQLPALVNGAFDAQPLGSGWTQLAKNLTTTLIYTDGSPFAALSRPNYAWLGGARNQTNQLRQSLTAALPANYAATLQFCYRLESAETAAGNDYVEIRAGEKTVPDAADNRLRIDLYAGAVTPGQQWQRTVVTLDALKGKTITIEFFSSLNAALNSNFLVDNVKLCVPAAVPGSNAPVCATEEFCSAATAATEAGSLLMERP